MKRDLCKTADLMGARSIAPHDFIPKGADKSYALHMLTGFSEVSKRVFIFIFAFAMLLAGQNAFSTDTNAVFDSWFAAQKNLQSWSADFVQSRLLKTLTQPLTATGHVDFAMPDDFRWALGNPARTIAVGNGDKMFVVYPFLKRAEIYPMGNSAPKQWRDMMSLLQAGLPRSREEFEAQFKLLSLVETNGNWLLNLQPKSRAVQQMMPELRIGLATNDFSLVSTELIFVDGSKMRNDFTNSILNQNLDKQLFEWQPPADYQVVSPLSK